MFEESAQIRRVFYYFVHTTFSATVAGLFVVEGLQDFLVLLRKSVLFGLVKDTAEVYVFVGLFELCLFSYFLCKLFLVVAKLVIVKVELFKIWTERGIL